MGDEANDISYINDVVTVVSELDSIVWKLNSDSRPMASIGVEVSAFC